MPRSGSCADPLVLEAIELGCARRGDRSGRRGSRPGLLRSPEPGRARGPAPPPRSWPRWEPSPAALWRARRRRRRAAGGGDRPAGRARRRRAAPPVRAGRRGPARLADGPPRGGLVPRDPTAWPSSPTPAIPGLGGVQGELDALSSELAALLPALVAVAATSNLATMIAGIASRASPSSSAARRARQRSWVVVAPACPVKARSRSEFARRWRRPPR